MTDPLRILVLGYIVRGPLGGLAWHHLQYAMGLRDLGHDVWFLEDSDDYPACYEPSTCEFSTDPGYGLRFTAATFDRVGLGDRWAYHDAHTDTWHGPAGGRALELCDSADLLLNVSGVNPLRPWLAGVPVRVLIDTDPVFTQIRHRTDPAARAAAAGHTAFFTFGENFGRPGCSIPDDGFPWRPTRQPVVLDAWPVTAPPAGGSFTTVMQWDSYPPREHDGRRFGMKSLSFEPYFDLPERTGERLELAVGSPTAPRDRLRAAGWDVVDPLAVTRDPWTYQDFIRRSLAEFTVAKHGYVVSRSGWFSERTAAYLASGRPAVVQDTGFTDWLPAGEGLFAFTNPDEAVAALWVIAAAPHLHAQAARELAAAYFDAADVLTRLLAEAATPAPVPTTDGLKEPVGSYLVSGCNRPADSHGGPHSAGPGRPGSSPRPRGLA